jgi:hypothetical protein
VAALHSRANVRIVKTFFMGFSLVVQSDRIVAGIRA